MSLIDDILEPIDNRMSREDDLTNAEISVRVLKELADHFSFDAPCEILMAAAEELETWVDEFDPTPMVAPVA